MIPLLAYTLFEPESSLLQNKTPLFILHGLLGSRDNWRGQARQLSRYRPVYTLDLRNHGCSPHIKGMSYREMYEDVINVAKHLGLNHFHLLGHSMGGKVAMQLALAQPSIVKSLIVVDIAPKPYPLWHQKTLQGVMSAPVEELTTRKEIGDYLTPWIEDSAERVFMLKNLKRSEDGKGFKWRCNLEEISKGYLKIAGFSTALETYPNECLFLKGSHSNYIQDSDTPVIKALFSKAEIVTIDDSGHLPHVQQPEMFFNQVQAFLSDL